MFGAKLSDDDYGTLEHYIHMVLRRFRDNKCELPEAYADIMHPLTAWDKGNKQEFVPYMKMKMGQWRGAEDSDT
jgi:hypothetical protein